MIYLDYNATTPVDPVVLAAMRPCLDEVFGNPSSSHGYGVRARQAVETARGQVAQAIGARPEEIVFTSGGTESNNHAIKGVALANRDRGRHIVTSAVEHPAVSEVCDWLAGMGFRIARVGVDADGRVDPAEVERALADDTVLVTIMHANNEVGTVQPIAEVAAIARARGIPVHTDAAQSMGKVPVRVDDLGVDLLSIAGHKLYAPKGIGALYVRTGTRLDKFMHGADHEGNRRAGTENILEIVGLGAACEMAAQDLEKNARHMRTLRDRLRDGLERELGEVAVNGHPEHGLPNTLSVSFPGIPADAILSELTEVAASAGAACHSDRIDVSATLAAMGVPDERAMGTVRLSTGRFLTEEEVDRAVDLVASAVRRHRPAEHEAPQPAATGDEIRLTRYTTGLGCACKLRPQALEQVLRGVPVRPDPAVLVGSDTADDAAVYRISDDLALVQSVDFFTPVVDDPYTFGGIAAANALSDLYAMGATPLFALSVVGFPSNRLPLETLTTILRGASDIAAKAGISIVGGHTIDDLEPKFGLAVTGSVHPDRILTNRHARPGDALVLTKPLGLGILTTALKRGMLDEDETRRAQDVMTELNAAAAEVCRGFPVHACTDVTGFGFLGHLREMAAASGVDIEVGFQRIPILPRAAELATGGIVPGGTLNNMEYVADAVDFDEGVSRTERILACDAQTSGGLLVSLPAAEAGPFVAALESAGVDAASVVGRVTGEGEGRIRVR